MSLDQIHHDHSSSLQGLYALIRNLDILIVEVDGVMLFASDLPDDIGLLVTLKATSG